MISIFGAFLIAKYITEEIARCAQDARRKFKVMERYSGSATLPVVVEDSFRKKNVR